MGFQQVTEYHVDFFRKLLGEENISLDDESLHHYSHDETEDLSFLPELVLKPASTDQISSIMKYCSAENICVTPRAAGTGLSGGALPVCGGVILSIEKLNRILFIDERNYR
jgi:glycolate oxidase